MHLGREEVDFNKNNKSLSINNGCQRTDDNCLIPFSGSTFTREHYWVCLCPHLHKQIKFSCKIILTKDKINIFINLLVIYTFILSIDQISELQSIITCNSCF